MKDVDYKVYKILLEEGEINWSAVPVTVRRSETFTGILSAGILQKERRGRGQKIVVAKKEAFDEYFRTHFPHDDAIISKSGNIRKYRNSKARRVESKPVFLLRGFEPVRINGSHIDLATYTRDYDVFAVVPKEVQCRKLCFVENLESFLHAELLLGKEYLFAHKYGRIGRDAITVFKAKEVTVFVDYDFNGLDEYLRIKSIFPQTELYVPEDYSDLFEKYAVSLTGNKARMSHAVRQSEDPVVQRIRRQVAENNRFLEQEIMIDV